MKKKVWWITAIVIIIILLLLIMPFHHKPKQATVAVKTGNISEKVVAVGQIEPLNISQIKSHVSGQVGSIFVQDGDYVKKGQRLVTVVPSPTPDEYAQARSTYEEAKAVLAQDKNTLAREQALLKRGLITKTNQNLDLAQQTYIKDRAAYQYALQELQLLESGKTKIGNRSVANVVDSPVDGYVLQNNVNVGDSVVPVTQSQAGTILFVVAKMKPLIFRGQVSQLDVNNIRTGMPAQLDVASVPNQSITGTVSLVSLMDTNSGNGPASNNSVFDAPDVYTHGFQIEVSHLKMPAGVTLRAGYQATANIVTKEKKGVLLLPQRVIHFDGKKAYVWLADHGKPYKQYIALGLSDNVSAQVAKGLQSGQTVLDK